MKIEAMFVELGDVLVHGRSRYEVTSVRFNSGGLGDSINFDLRNLRTQRIRKSEYFTHDCLLEVELTDEEARSRLADR